MSESFKYITCICNSVNCDYIINASVYNTTDI